MNVTKSIYYIVSAIIFLTIISFSCSNVERRNYNSIDNNEIIITEQLSYAEEMRLASLFSGNKVEKIDKLLDMYRTRFRFHGNVLVGYNGMLIYNRAFGTSDFVDNTPMDIDCVFQLASVSKQFTAMSVMLLVQDGLLNVTDTIKNIIPEFPYEKVTIEQLLHHTGGMPNYMWLLEHKWQKGKKAYNDDIITLMNENETPRYFRPGSRYDYSNTGYAILAYIVEYVSGVSFPDFVAQRIFKPLQMNNSFVYSSAFDKKYPERLHGHYRRWRRYNVIKETVHDGIVGDKGVFSTTGDLYKWDQALYSDVLISDTLRKAAFTPVKVRGRYEYPYGYGFRLKKVDGKQVVYHTGLWEGFRTNLMRYVETGNTIIVLNHTNINVNNIMVKRIENILAEPNKVTNTQKIVSISIKEGCDKALGYFYKISKSDNNFVDINKILESAELLTLMGKPQLSGVLIKVYENIVSSISFKEKVELMKNVV
ncbi:MAG: serine hydrolase domain-containing protein [Bacteroidota bacterium]|nr:serine hydrolase domain-containing protein [Bacteroidota bacterium]